VVGFLVAYSIGWSVGQAGTLVINANSADPAPRAAWESAVARFQRENPDIRVEFNVYDHESYKKAIRNWLTGAPPDVVFWFAGNRMRQFTVPGLLADLSELYTPEVRRHMHPSAVDVVSHGGRQYAVPYTYYQVGFYYRRDVLEAAGIAEAPQTFAELLSACDQLKARGIEPFAIGTRDLWPAAAWFDYLDLRSNGYAFHRALMQGEVAYTDARVRVVFERWRELLDRDCFSRNHASMSWQESQTLLYQGKSAMMLIGNYIVANFPPDVRDRMDFARFPTLRADVARFEEAPTNTVHVPAKARNKDEAMRFMAFVLRADVQEALNKAMVQLPVNTQAAVADDRFLRKGRDLLTNADALTQFFDRDTSEDLAVIAMKGFQEFMLQPQRVGAILTTIERARERIYGPLPRAASLGQ
jgi:multiple sugar transport system substrate-binding protein